MSLLLTPSPGGAVAQGLVMDDRSNTLVIAWFETLALSFGISWFVQDIIVIVVRNNLKMTKTSIRDVKYQGLEKFVLAPLAWLKSMLAGAIQLLLGMN